MKGEKVVIWMIKDLEEAGFTVSVEEPGEYPVIKAVKGRSVITIDTDGGDVEGKATRKTARRFGNALSWCFTDVRDCGRNGKVEGRLFGTLCV